MFFYYIKAFKHKYLYSLKEKKTNFILFRSLHRYKVQELVAFVYTV